VLKLHIKYYTKHNNGTQNVTGATYTWVSQVLCKNVDNHGDPGRKHQQLFKITKLQVNCNGLLWTSCYSARPPGIPFFNVQNSPVKQKIPEKYPCQQWIVFDMWCFMWQQNFTRLTTIKRSRVGNSICLSQTVRAYVAGVTKILTPWGSARWIGAWWTVKSEPSPAWSPSKFGWTMTQTMMVRYRIKRSYIACSCISAVQLAYIILPHSATLGLHLVTRTSTRGTEYGFYGLYLIRSTLHRLTANKSERCRP